VVAIGVFGILKRFNLLRVEMSTELAGLDNMEHGGPAYEWTVPGEWAGCVGVDVWHGGVGGIEFRGWRLRLGWAVTQQLK